MVEGWDDGEESWIDGILEREDGILEWWEISKEPGASWGMEYWKVG